MSRGNGRVMTDGRRELRDGAREVRIRRLRGELDRREAMARAAKPSADRHFGWSNLAPGSGLTEAQEDFVDYWAPQRILEECEAKRQLIGAIADWGPSTDLDRDRLDHLLDTLAFGLTT